MPLQCRSPDSGLLVRVVRDAREWDSMERAWRALYAASPAAAPPLSWDWLREWWRLYGPACAGTGGLCILAAYRGARLAGILPLYLRGASAPWELRRLQFLSSGEAQNEETCAEYLNLLYLPGEGDACARAFGAALAADGAWDELKLDAVPPDSPLLAWSMGVDRRWGARVAPQEVCPAANLEGGFEAYLGRLSSGTREQARRLLRAVEKEGLDFSLAEGPEDVDRFLDALIELHQQRWEEAGKAGCFRADRFSRLHRSLARGLVPTGAAVLARLSAGARPLAVIYGFPAASRFHFYQCGVLNERWGHLRSPGIAAHLLLMAKLAGRGVTRYDFLGGSAAYKDRLATEEQSLVGIRMVRRSLRAAVQVAARQVGRVRAAGRRLAAAGAAGRSQL